jgi:hypothetical protein
MELGEIIRFLAGNFRIWRLRVGSQERKACLKGILCEAFRHSAQRASACYLIQNYFGTPFPPTLIANPFASVIGTLNCWGLELLPIRACSLSYSQQLMPRLNHTLLHNQIHLLKL